MGLKIVIPTGYQRVRKISLTAMGFRGKKLRTYTDEGTERLRDLENSLRPLLKNFASFAFTDFGLLKQ